MHRSLLYPPCLAEISLWNKMLRVHTHSGEFSLNDSLWAPHNHMCALTYAIHRRAVSILPQESTHETATWAETRESWGHGIWPRRLDRVVLSYLPSIFAWAPHPTVLPFGSPRPVRLGCPAHKHAYKSLVCCGTLPQPSGAHVNERFEQTVYLGALGNLSVTTGVCVCVCCTVSVLILAVQISLYS